MRSCRDTDRHVDVYLTCPEVGDIGEIYDGVGCNHFTDALYLDSHRVACIDHVVVHSLHSRRQHRDSRAEVVVSYLYERCAIPILEQVSIGVVVHIAHARICRCARIKVHIGGCQSLRCF